MSFKKAFNSRSVYSIGMHQCYYCEQLFATKEELYEHVEVHTDVERNREITSRRKKKTRKK